MNIRKNQQSKSPSLVDLVLLLLLSTGLLVACSGGSSSTGSGGATATHSMIQQARDLIRPYYPAAARIPIRMTPDNLSARVQNGVAYISNLYLSQVSSVAELGCAFMLHEYIHTLQGYTAKGTPARFAAEREAFAYSVECLRRFDAPGWIISYYAGQDGTHGSSLASVRPAPRP